jgi:hypothetical protein
VPRAHIPLRLQSVSVEQELLLSAAGAPIVLLLPDTAADDRGSAA